MIVKNSGIVLNPVGVVRSTAKDIDTVSVGGQVAEVEVFPQYSPALTRIEANSHLWLLLWFHESDRNCLLTVPRRINPNLSEYGVFGLRSPNRPNPIALSLVELDSVDGNILKVRGLDAIDGTPVLDIKSYFEKDIIFSPMTPYIRPLDPEMRRNMMLKEALSHHQEACLDLYLAVRMGLVADEFMGHLNSPDLNLTVIGSACLADTLQGLSRARLSNPPRFTYEPSQQAQSSMWTRPGRRLTISAQTKLTHQNFAEISDEDLFRIELTE